MALPFIARFLPKPVYKHPLTIPIIDSQIKALPFTVTDYIIFINKTVADQIRSENFGRLPDRYYGFKIAELDPHPYALAD